MVVTHSAMNSKPPGLGNEKELCAYLLNKEEMQVWESTPDLVLANTSQ